MKLSNTIIIKETLLPSNKKAFTLAEVLITLSILGIVAALTVPMLINRQSDLAAITKLKKAISTFEQAADVYMVENESSDITGMAESCATLKQYFKTTKDNGSDSGCVFTTGDGAHWEFLPDGIAMVMDSDKKPRFTVLVWAAGGQANMGITGPQANNSGDSYLPATDGHFSFKDTSNNDITNFAHYWYHLAPTFLKLSSNDIIRGLESIPLYVIGGPGGSGPVEYDDDDYPSLPQ